MTKAEIIKQLKEEAGLASLAQAENAYNTLFSLLGKALKKWRQRCYLRFWQFQTGETRRPQGRNPRSGEEIQIPESTVVKFTPSKTLKESL